MSGVMFINNAVNYVALAGQEEWVSDSGTFTWIVPRGVYEIHACVIGGGGGGGAHATAPACGGNGGSLAWGNKIPVKPGEALTIVVGGGGSNVLASAQSGGAGGESYIARGATRLISAAGGAGGGTTLAGANQVSSTPLYNGTSSVYGLTDASYGYGGTSFITSAASSERCSGGGGAAGYTPIANIGTMTGGIGGPSGTATQSLHGGGAGGAGGISNTTGGAGGGTGPWGQGTSGFSQSTGGSAGGGGSDGLPAVPFSSAQALCLPTAWSESSLSYNGGLFGGGGAGGLNSNPGTGSGFGARGCVRIMWGEGRGYPATNTGNYYGTTAVTNSQQNYFTPGSYTWNVPAGVTEFSACTIGGGGSGMQGSSTTGKGSGGGGALAWATFNCKPDEQFSVVVGAGGQSTALNVSQAGGTSSIVRNASFEGFISGTNLYVTKVLRGTVTVGMSITGLGVTTATISAFQTGENGNEGTYTVSVSQTVGTLFSVIGMAGTLTILSASGGGGAPSGAGGVYFFHTSSAKAYNGQNGGNGAAGSTSTTAQGASGGGAGGYRGTAGGNGARAGTAVNGSYPTPYAANRYSMTGGSSSGRTGGASLAMGAGGGGTGIYGIGKDANFDTGQVSSGLNGAGQGGSGGTNGAAPAGNGQGGTYGGGGGGAGNNFTAGRSNGGPGGVRIIWGARHKYPAPTTDV